ncbi:MAG: histidine kinase N-terminal 7TM domain-containing protein [Christensenellales bacterium]
MHRDDRRWLLLGCAMAVLWLFLRAVKYRFFSDDTITRHLWYLYYVPQILATLFSLFAALQLGRREGDALSRKWYLLFIPAVLLIGGVLTNDLHQLVFLAVPGAATLEADYTHGWMYYLAMTWIVGLLLATGIIVYRKCRVSESRRYAWIPLCVFLGGFFVRRFRQYLHLYKCRNALPGVCGVLETPAGGAAADQWPLPLFRIYRRRALE